MKYSISLLICLLFLCSCSIKTNNTLASDTRPFTDNKAEQQESAIESIDKTETVTDSFVHVEPTRLLTIGANQLEELRSYAKLSEEELCVYVISSYNVEMSKNDVDIFLKAIDSIPRFSAEKINVNAVIQYRPEESQLNISYILSDSAWYRFEYVISDQAKKDAYSYIEANGNVGAEKVEFALNVTSQSKIYSVNAKLLHNSDFSDNEKLADKYTEFWIEIGSCLLKISYMNSSGGVSSAAPEEIMGNFSITDLPESIDQQ